MTAGPDEPAGPEPPPAHEPAPAPEPAAGPPPAPEPAAPREQERRGPSPSLLVLGAALVLGGLLWLLEEAGVVDVSLAAALAGALLAVGLVLVAGSLRGPRPGLVWLGTLLAVLAVGASAGGDLRLSGGIGERTERPATAEGAAEPHRLGIGSLTVDVTRLPLETGTTSVEASVVVGELVVLVPREVAFEARGRAAIGEVDLVGEQHTGFAVDANHAEPGFAEADERLELDLSVGIGSIEVRRAP